MSDSLSLERGGRWEWGSLPSWQTVWRVHLKICLCNRHKGTYGAHLSCQQSIIGPVGGFRQNEPVSLDAWQSPRWQHTFTHLLSVRKGEDCPHCWGEQRWRQQHQQSDGLSFTRTARLRGVRTMMGVRTRRVPSHPTWSHFAHLFQQSRSFSHYPKLMTTVEGGDEDWPVNQQLCLLG